MTDTTTTNTDSVFGTATPTEPTQQGGSDNGLLSSLVGEGKKFKSVEDLARGKVESDKFIEKLTEELAEMRKELTGMASMTQTVEELKKLRNQPQGGSTTTEAPVDPEQLITAVEKRLSEKSEAKKREENILEADRMIVDIFKGDRAKSKEFLESKAKELGVGVNWLVDVAANNPKAVLNLLGLAQQTSQPAAKDPSSVVNTSSQTFVQGGAPQRGTKAYYEDIRRKDKTLYFSTKIQNEIFEAQKAGTYK